MRGSEYQGQILTGPNKILWEILLLYHHSILRNLETTLTRPGGRNSYALNRGGAVKALSRSHWRAVYRKVPSSPQKKSQRKELYSEWYSSVMAPGPKFDNGYDTYKIRPSPHCYYYHCYYDETRP